MSPKALGTPKDEQAIRDTAAQFIAAWNRNDGRALAACFASDGDLINSAGRICRGRREVEKLALEGHAGPLKGSHMTMPQKHLRFLKPDLAIAEYDFEVSHVRGADGKESIMKGLTTVVLRKDGDSWLIVAARPMIPLPVPETHH